MTESELPLTILGEELLNELRRTDIGRLAKKPYFRDEWWQLTNVMSTKFVSIDAIKLYFTILMHRYPKSKIYFYSVSMVILEDPWVIELVDPEEKNTSYIVRFAIKMDNLDGGEDLP